MMDYTAKVREHLLLEAGAIELAAKRLDSDAINRAVQRLLACEGKVLIVGMGKSGDVGRKIAATLNSTGTNAAFLHPADALHGDLGMVLRKDAVIALSNSGETDEILLLLPHLRRREVPIIAIIGNLGSSLGRGADIVIDASVEREACPFNLAPTTSTTVALALGDALAITLMQAKGITQDGFAMNHPAGRLGKRLTLTVNDLMHSGARNPKLPSDANWLEVVARITDGGLGAVNIVDRHGMLIGFITDGDVRRAIQATPAERLEGLSAQRIMTANPVTVEPETLAYDALKLMEQRSSPISQLPVVTSGRSVGMVRLHDLLRSGLA